MNSITYPLVSCQNQLGKSSLATEIDRVDILPDDEICNIRYDNTEYVSRVLYEEPRVLE